MQINQGQLQTTDGTVLDPKVVKVMRAIRQVESSGGDYNAVGDDGDAHGAFQYNERTGPGWSNLTTKYLGDPNAPMDRTNQNKVTYMRIKEWKDQGRDPEEIAALWNGASKDPQTGRYVYNKPAYGEEFRKALLGSQQPGGNYPTPPPPQQFPPATSTGFDEIQEQMGINPKDSYFSRVGQEVTGAFDKAGQAMQSGMAPQGTPGKQNFFSGLLQSGGAFAQGGGGVVDESIKSVPYVGQGYEMATDLIGGAVGGALESKPGQAAVESLGIDEWSDEAKANAEALLNIVSLFPLGGGLATGIRGAGALRTSLTKGSVTDAAREQVTGAASETQDAKSVLKNAEGINQDPVGLIINNQDYMPEVVDLPDGRRAYSTRESLEKIEKDLEADEVALQNLLNSTIPNQGAGIQLSKVIDDVLTSMKKPGQVDVNIDAKERYLKAFFENTKRSLGRDYINLTDLNELKRQARKPVNYSSKDPYGTVSKKLSGELSTNLMKQVEKYAEKAGVKGVGEFNKLYGSRLSAKEVLEFLDGRPIRYGQRGRGGLIKSVSRGVPFLEGLVDYTGRKLNRTPSQRLKDKRPLARTAGTGLVQLGTGLAGTGQLSSEE